MATDIFLPILGESITEAVLLNWLKQAGDSVKRGEVIAELETDKATLELESPENGVLDTILVPAGETVVTGQRLAVILRPGEVAQAPKPAPALPPQPEAARPEPILEPSPVLPDSNPNPGSRVSPAARKRARELGIEIELVPAAAPGERVTSQDVENYAALQSGGSKAPAAIVSHTVAMSDTRKVTARRMTESARDIPQYSVSMDVEMEHFNRVLSAAREMIAAGDGKVTVTALMMYLVCRAIRQHPLVNARYQQDHIEVMDTINLAIATRTPAGLAAPVVVHAEEMALSVISHRLAELANRARQGILSLNEVTSGTFSISNLGMFGITQFTPLINPPQAAILGIGAIRSAAFPTSDAGIGFKSILTLTLTADHRVLDGTDSAEFLATLKTEIEQCEISNIIL